MRITFNGQYRDLAAAVEKSSERLLVAQQRVSSGRRLNKISDDPTAAATSISERSNLGALEQYTRATDSVSSRLTVADTVLSDIIEKITTSRTLAQNARGTHKSTAQLEAIAGQLRGMRDALLDGLNTSFMGNFVFAGAQATTQPYSKTGNSVNPYGGSTNAVQLDIGEGRSVAVAFNGESIARGSDTEDVFQTLESLITAVTAGDNDAIGAGMAGLQRAFDRAVAAQARIGNDMQIVASQKLRLQEMELSTKERLSKLEDVNMAEAITDMSHADAAYRGTLGAIGTVSRVSLMDYLK